MKAMELGHTYVPAENDLTTSIRSEFSPFRPPPGRSIKQDHNKTITPLHRMDLPEELLDEIFSHLPSYDEQSLRSCSLVSKSWLEPSRRLLFSNIRIHQDNYLSWLNNISPTNAGLLRNVRSLAYFFRVYDNPDPRCCVCALHDYFPSFHQLRALEFYKLDIEPTIPDHLTLFSTFQHTLFSLSLTHGLITWSSFVALVGYFPHLRDLTVRGPRFQVDDRPVPQILHPLRGRLVVDSYLPDESMKLFVNRFPELKQEYEELEITTSFEPRLLTAVEGSLKYLTLHRCERMLLWQA